MASVKVGSRSLLPGEVRSLGDKLARAFDQLTPYDMFRVLTTCGVVAACKEAGLFDGFMPTPEQAAMSDRDRLLDNMRRRGLGGDVAMAKLFMEYVPADEAHTTQSQVTLIITPYQVPDGVKVVMENPGAKDAENIRTRLTKTT
jgi:hypothetical protein